MSKDHAGGLHVALRRLVNMEFARVVDLMRDADVSWISVITNTRDNLLAKRVTTVGVDLVFTQLTLADEYLVKHPWAGLGGPELGFEIMEISNQILEMTKMIEVLKKEPKYFTKQSVSEETYQGCRFYAIMKATDLVEAYKTAIKQARAVVDSAGDFPELVQIVDRGFGDLEGVAPENDKAFFERVASGSLQDFCKKMSDVGLVVCIMEKIISDLRMLSEDASEALDKHFEVEYETPLLLKAA